MKRGILAEWEYKGESYFIILGRKKSLKNEFELGGFFNEVCIHNPDLLISIRDGEIKLDKLRVVWVVKESLKTGYLVGTKEILLVKLDQISNSMIHCNTIKIRVLSNIYNSLIDSCQALFISHKLSIPVPKQISFELKKSFSGNFDSRTISFASDIITYFKSIEHGKIAYIEGKKLDELSRKLSLFKEIAKQI